MNVPGMALAPSCTTYADPSGATSETFSSLTQAYDVLIVNRRSDGAFPGTPVTCT